MRTLDRTRDYGTIQGDDEGRVYEQDGHYFRGDGSLWGAAAKAKPQIAKSAPAPAPATSPVDDQLSQQLQG